VYVLVDIEWVGDRASGREITQIAASRVSEGWESTAEFSCLVCPMDAEKCDWAHVAYRGYTPDEFLNGDSEAASLRRFAEFLQDDDVLCIWAGGAKYLLREKYAVYIGEQLPNRCVCVNNKVCGKAQNLGVQALEMYAVAEALGLDTPASKHCSVCDLVVLRALLATLNVKQKKKAQTVQAHSVKKVVSNRERNIDILARAAYHFVFTPNSEVFHRPTCNLVLRANDIRGCVYYENAVKKRRPCKRCKPEPIEDVDFVQKDDPQGQSTSTNHMPPDAIVTAKLLGNQRIQIKKSKLVGCCHSVLHPGKLTAKIMEAHNCLGKQCKSFEKYEDSTYWLAQAQKQREKEKRKAAQQLQKQASQRMEEKLEETTALFQSFADQCEYDLLIVRLQKENRHHYKIFYVSENRFADGNQFPHFLEAVRAQFPKYRVEFRHIRDVDGHFVTIDEYLMRNKK
jgi:hypothetical protein